MRVVSSTGRHSASPQGRRWPHLFALLAALALVAGLFGMQAGSAAAATSARARGSVAHGSAAHVAAAALQSHRPPLRPVVRNAVRHDTSQPLRKMKAVRKPPSAKIKVLPLRMPPHALANPRAPATSGLTRSGAVRNGAAAVTRTADVQKSVLNDTMPTFQQNFEGVGNVNGVMPPDTEGAVGPNDYVQMINLSFAVYNKQGSLLYGPVPNTTRPARGTATTSSSARTRRRTPKYGVLKAGDLAQEPISGTL